jgi:MobA/MobL family protein
MAQYHFAARIIQRSKGQSAVASAAYRAGERLNDNRLGAEFDFRRHLGVVYSDIMLPPNAPDWMRDREQLWNAVEKAEKRKDSQLARSIDIALPHELSLALNIELLRGFVQEQYVDNGMITDIAIHLPGRNGDIRNVHAHIALTTREITGSGFGPKQRDWNDKQELRDWRKAWADHANRILEREGFDERIDHRSLVDQGIDREPTTHIGPAGKEMDQRGVSSDRAQINREIEAINDNLELAKQDLARSEERLAELLRLKALADHTARVWENAPTLQPQAPPDHRETNTAKAPSGGKAPSMTDDTTEQELAAQREAERQNKTIQEEKERQDKAAKEQADHLKKIAEDEKTRLDNAAKAEADQLQKLADYNKRVEQIAWENAQRQAVQAEEIRREHARQQELNRKAEFDAHKAELARQAQKEKQDRLDARNRALEQQQAQGHIREAGMRYGLALATHYDMNDPYGSLAKSAMAEYALFIRDRESYTKQIAEEKDPVKLQSLELRKRIEGAEYLALTGERIAKQSELITGRLNSEEAVKERAKVAYLQSQSKEARQQLRALEPAQALVKQPIPKPRPYRPRGGKSARELDALIREEDAKQILKEQKLKEEQRLKENEDERQRQLDLERKRKDRGRER